MGSNGKDDEKVAGSSERERSLAMALGQIDKQFGKGAVMRLGDHAQRLHIEAIPTGSLGLDIALGVGGLPRGRVVELFGPESSGKSTLALHVVAEAQKLGGVAAFLDAEHALDPVYAGNLGVDIDSLLVSQPDTGEQALEIADMLIRSNAIDVLVVDSVAALVPRAEIEGEMGDTHVGLQARLMSQALRKLTGSVSKSRTCVIFINQIREKIGVMFGSNETTPGGRALKFYSSVRLDVRRVEAIKDGAEMIGNRVRAKVVKNKCVAEGTTIFDPTTGLTHRIEDIVDHGEGTSVFATDKLGQLHVKPIADRMDQGMQNVIGVSFRGGTVLWVTPDHKILTDGGWREAGELRPGDWVGRPRRTYGFGDQEPVAPDQARLLGYLIGDGYVGGKTPIAFINAQEVLREDVARIADELGCRTKLRGRHGLELAISHRIGEQNGVLALARWAGIWGHLAPGKRIPAPFFAPDCSEEVVANLLFGIWESDGWISREQTGAIRCGFVTTSEQLANQIHWLLLRWGIGSSIGMHKPGERWSVIDGRRVQAKLPCWQVRVGGIENVVRFAEALPMWGPRGQILTSELSNPALRKHRGSQRIYLPRTATEPVLVYLRDMGVTTRFAAQVVGYDKPYRVGMRAILGASRLRRDRVAKLAEALDSEFLRGILNEDVYYARVKAVEPKQRRRTFDLTIDELHNFVADDVVVHNCAPPFRTAEFDLMYSKGISKEGSLLDVAVEYGIVKKSGAWFTYEGDQLGQGRENAKEFLTSNADLAKAIEGQIREIVSPNGKVDPEELEALEALEEELEPVDE